MTNTTTQTEARTTMRDAINRQATTVFRTRFAEHPQRESDPASALEDAKRDAAAHIPDGVVGTFDDEALTFVAEEQE